MHAIMGYIRLWTCPLPFVQWVIVLRQQPALSVVLC